MSSKVKFTRNKLTFFLVGNLCVDVCLSMYLSTLERPKVDLDKVQYFLCVCDEGNSYVLTCLPLVVASFKMKNICSVSVSIFCTS